MSVQSMTGFGRGEAQNENFSVTVEIKSVNNRYKDYRFKMPSVFNSIESQFKSVLKDSFKRGSFDIYINVKKVGLKSKITDLDFDKINAFIDSFKGLGVQYNATDFLRQEFLKEEDSEDHHIICTLGLEAFEAACLGLKQAREGEGAKLKVAISEHLTQFRKHFDAVTPLVGTLESSVKEKLVKRFKEFDDLSLDEPRFMQEVVYYLEKLDVNEEIDRINSHLSKLDSLLDQAEIGRQIDFLVQELNRETNTIGSKSSLKELSHHVVQMKVNLEKVREQGLNLQ